MANALTVVLMSCRALADVHPDGSAGSDQEPEEPAPEFAVLPEGKVKYSLLIDCLRSAQELTQEDIASSLHHLGKSADDTKFTYLKANLQVTNIMGALTSHVAAKLTNRQALGVSQVAALASYVDLQNVDLSENLLRGTRFFLPIILIRHRNRCCSIFAGVAAPKRLPEWH